MVDRKDVIDTCVYEKLHNDDINGANDLLDEHLKSAHKGNKKETNVVTNPFINMENVNRASDEYITALSDNTISEPATQVLLDRYISTRHTSITRSLHFNPPHKYYSIVTYQPATQVLLDRYISTRHTSITRSLHINPPHKYYSIVTYQPATQVLLDRYISTRHTSITRSLHINPPHKLDTSITRSLHYQLENLLRVKFQLENDKFGRAQMQRHIKIERYENILAIR